MCLSLRPMGTARSVYMARRVPRKRLSNVSGKVRSTPENLSLNVIAKQSPEADLREKYFLTLPKHSAGSGRDLRVAIRSLRGEGRAASGAGLFPKRSGISALAERWLH